MHLFMHLFRHLFIHLFMHLFTHLFKRNVVFLFIHRVCGACQIDTDGYMNRRNKRVTDGTDRRIYETGGTD